MGARPELWIPAEDVEAPRQPKEELDPVAAGDEAWHVAAPRAPANEVVSKGEQHGRPEAERDSEGEHRRGPTALADEQRGLGFKNRL